MSFVPKYQAEIDRLVASADVEALRAYEQAAAKSVGESGNNPINLMYYNNALIARRKAEKNSVKFAQQAAEKKETSDKAELDRISRNLSIGCPDDLRPQAKELRRLLGFQAV